MTTARRTGPPIRWTLPPEDAGARAEALRAALPGLPAPLSLVLAARGVDDPAAARTFLRPSLDDLHDPSTLPGLREAADRLETAIASGETVFVHGDFDADGMCATALAVRALRRLGVRTVFHVPHRTNDGYDLRPEGVARASATGAGLILTVDCGVTAIAAVAEAASTGIDVVVTDHHRAGPSLPAAVAIVNPQLPDSRYPFAGLAGVGVAFKLVAALFARRGVPDEELYQHLDLVAIGTLADQMPLTGENRILVRAGLRALARTRKPGLRALLRSAGIDPRRPIAADDIGFRLGPRLNSVGRMAAAEAGVRLLLTDDPAEAEALAAHLDEQNVARRRTDRIVTEDVERQLAMEGGPPADPALVVWADGWHRGVMGIVASRLVDRWQRPAFVVSFEGGVGEGSARSVDGFHLVEALRECEGLLETYGGHQMAAGLRIRRERIEEFAARMRELASARLAAVPATTRELAVDLDLRLSEVDADLEVALRHLAPHGNGNPLPLIAVRHVAFERPETVGREQAHLRLRLCDGERRLGAIGFGFGSRHEEASGPGPFDVAFHLERDEWRGRERVRARLVDFRPSDA